jgi:hypothetical protein
VVALIGRGDSDDPLLLAAFNYLMNYLQTYKGAIDEKDEKERQTREAAKKAGTPVKRVAPTLPGAKAAGMPPQLLEPPLIASLLDSLFKFLKTTADQVLSDS